ncbi:MAG: GNAT family N-acyltransferase [Pseudomonadota bacterium]
MALVSANSDIRQSQADIPVTINGKIGSLTTRLAVKRSEIHEAQRIRYQVFCEEMSARKTMLSRVTQRETDKFDQACDHLIVCEKAIEQQEKIIGTQRFMIGCASDEQAGFYSQSEFDLNDLTSRHPGKVFMELGRSCILPDYRNKRTMELMWHGTWAYARQKSVDVMVGCASFATTEVETLGPVFAFLSQNALADDVWQTAPVGRTVISLTENQSANVDLKKAFHQLPPLIKGYLRLGAKICKSAVVDHDFGTTDIMIVLPVRDINPRYISYYGEDANRHCA